MIVQCVGSVVSKLELPFDIGNFHIMFRVSVLEKCLADVPILVSVSDVRLATIFSSLKSWSRS